MKSIFKKIKILHLVIAAILIIGVIFSYYTISYVRAKILITQPILSDFNESGRRIFENELGIKFVENTIITESKYTPGIDTSFDLIFAFPEDEIDGFYKGITDYYIEKPIRYPQTQRQITLKGTYIKGYDHRKKVYTSLDLYKADANMIIVHINYDAPSSRLIKLLMDKVREKGSYKQVNFVAETKVISDSLTDYSDIEQLDYYQQIVKAGNLTTILSFDYTMKYFTIPEKYRNEFLTTINVNNWVNVDGVTIPNDEWYTITFLDEDGKKYPFTLLKNDKNMVIKTEITTGEPRKYQYYLADPSIFEKIAQLYQKCIPVFETSEKSILALYKFALDVAGKQLGLKSRVTADNEVKKSDLIANPDLFSELGASDKTQMIKYVEEKTGRKIVFKTHEECVSEGIADYSRMNSFGFIDGKYSEFSMRGSKINRNTYAFMISFFTGLLASIGCSFKAEFIDNKWQIEDKIEIRQS